MGDVKQRVVRIYNNGMRVAEDVTDPADWLEYNSVMRFGCALFVDGACKHYGYLGQERCEALEKTLTGANP